MRGAALVLLCLSLACVAGTAKADVFQVVPTQSTAFVPPPPAQPEQLGYPQLLGLWQGAGAQYGVPWQVLAAINKVESDFGRNMGPSSAGAVGWMQFMPATWLEYALKRRSAAAGEGLTEGEAQRELQRRRVEAPPEGGELDLGVPDLRIVRPGL